MNIYTFFLKNEQMNRVDMYSNFTTCTSKNVTTFFSPIVIEPQYINLITLTINGKTETLFDSSVNNAILEVSTFNNKTGECSYKITK